MNYSELPKEELVLLLLQRDEEIRLLQQNITDMNGSIEQQRQTIANLEEAIRPISANAIGAINRLNIDEQRKLALEIRTTPEGIKALVSFLYGVKEPVIG